jgi:hypothetical protein
MNCSSFPHVGIALLLCLACPVAASAEPPAAKELRTAVESEKTIVAFFVHPTATLKKLAFDGCTKAETGYQVEYSFTYESAFGNPFTTRVAFSCDANGKFTDDIKAISTTNENPFAKPFAGFNRILKLVKAVLLEEPEIKDDAELSKAIEKAEAANLCSLYVSVILKGSEKSRKIWDDALTRSYDD